MSNIADIESLKKIIDLSQQMLDLADSCDASRMDAGCGAVYGTLRDDAYKVRRMAEKELKRQRSKSSSTANQEDV